MLTVAAHAGNSVTGSLVNITLAAGEAAKVNPGDIVGSYGAETEAAAWVGYVIAVNGTTSVITCVNGCHGSTPTLWPKEWMSCHFRPRPPQAVSFDRLPLRRP